MKKRVAVLISGGGSNMVRLLEDMADPDHPAEPVLVLSNNADAGGLRKAREMGVATAVVDHRPFKGDRVGFDAAIHHELVKAGADIVCAAGFLRIFTAEFVTKWDGKILNIHPSLLPKYKGLNTHARAIDAGETEHGCTVHLMVPDLDAGPALGQAVVPVEPDDTPDSLAARVLTKEHQLYPAVLRRFATGDMSVVRM